MSADRAAKKEEERLKGLIKELLERPENHTCCDCGARGPKWASINLGCLLCIRCAGLHRKMGTHISKVKSTNLDKWNDDYIQTISKFGNQNVNRIYLSNGSAPRVDINDDFAMETYIRNKYEKKKFMLPDAMRELEALEKSHPKPNEASPATTKSIGRTETIAKPPDAPKRERTRSITTTSYSSPQPKTNELDLFGDFVAGPNVQTSHSQQQQLYQPQLLAISEAQNQQSMMRNNSGLLDIFANGNGVEGVTQAGQWNGTMVQVPANNPFSSQMPFQAVQQPNIFQQQHVQVPLQQPQIQAAQHVNIMPQQQIQPQQQPLSQVQSPAQNPLSSKKNDIMSLFQQQPPAITPAAISFNQFQNAQAQPANPFMMNMMHRAPQPQQPSMGVNPFMEMNRMNSGLHMMGQPALQQSTMQMPFGQSNQQSAFNGGIGMSATQGNPFQIQQNQNPYMQSHTMNTPSPFTSMSQQSNYTYQANDMAGSIFGPPKTVHSNLQNIPRTMSNQDLQSDLFKPQPIPNAVPPGKFSSKDLFADLKVSF